MPTREERSFCRICGGGCGILLTIDDDNKILKMRGDDASALSRGYACFKGLQAEESHHGPARILRPLKRMGDGQFAELPLEVALDEIAARLGPIVTEDPNALAVFCGNGAMVNSAAYTIHRPFLKAFGSKQYYSTITIDQSAKYVSAGRLGSWTAGTPRIDDMDVALLFGTNPLVSHAALGMLSADPVRHMKRLRAGGLKLIVVDPRETETARNADLLLQPFPGEDAAIAAGLLRIILAQGWEDHDFCARFVGSDRMADLRQAVEPFDADLVAQRAGLAANNLVLAAQMFARDADRGCAYGATGPNMARFSNAAQHLIDCLNVICGRFLREGDLIHSVNMFDPARPFYAEARAPDRAWEQHGDGRIRGVDNLYGERLSATLADEILTPGRDRIRALIIDGGDLMNSLPDRPKTRSALADLDLLVSIDPWMTPTSTQADYILPPKLQYERADLSASLEGFTLWPGAWVNYSPAVLPTPAGSDITDDWYVFWSLAKRLGRQIVFANRFILDMSVSPSTDELLAMLLDAGQTSLDEVRASPGGKMFDLPPARVQPSRPDVIDRFDVMPPDVAAELQALLAVPGAAQRVSNGGRRFTHRLASRRHRDFFNSNGVHLRTVRARNPYNPAHLHPDDMAELGVTEGGLVELVSEHGRTRAFVAADPTVRRGVVSISHGWGGLTEDDSDIAASGTCVNKLVDTEQNYESINAMPHFSGVAVDILPVRDLEQAP